MYYFYAIGLTLCYYVTFSFLRPDIFTWTHFWTDFYKMSADIK